MTRWLGLAPAEAGPDPDVALEAYGWYWTADVLQAAGARVHLVHPSGLHWGARRVKNDQRDATEIAQRQRRNDLPEAWIARLRCASCGGATRTLTPRAPLEGKYLAAVA